jgi:hypothetical protein
MLIRNHYEKSKSSRHRAVKAILTGAVLATLGASPISAWSTFSYRCENDKNVAESACASQKNECKKDCSYPDEQQKDVCETSCRDERDAAKRQCSSQYSNDPGALAACNDSADSFHDMCKEECGEVPSECQAGCDWEYEGCQWEYLYEYDDCLVECEALGPMCGS